VRDNFQKENVLAGLANIFVIEYSALNIINKLEQLFSERKDQFGNKLYTDYELEHKSLHQVIEVEHDAEAHELLRLLNLSEASKEELFGYVDDLSSTLGKYWSALNKRFYN